MSTLSSLLKPGHTAVVTGASSGIGRAACLEFVKRGMNVWMIDIDEEQLQLAHSKVQETAVVTPSSETSQIIEYRVADVSSLQGMMAVADDVFTAAATKNDAASCCCHVLMNNAGIGQGGGAMTNMETVHKVMGVNTYGPIHGCLTFVPKMKASGQPGIIINTGSKQGITMPPGNLTYNMSKAALKVYTEGLEHELRMERMEKGGKLRAALLIPGWVNTSIVAKTIEAQGGNIADAPFHEDKPATGAWMPHQVIEFMISELDDHPDRFYVVCPDNDVDRATDNLRMTWTMQDITENRPPLSRWHPEYQEQFQQFLTK
ncbi:oxidoreductase [Nitzschia inconspicua]|uniref:Oxidoreductase n=1 Tax=Nitzschia inconspicua TaxID=303405 RepID=A0A9K3KKW7_9STRA|nr:oxidoreductase [Nitzschia inconspicua]